MKFSIKHFFSKCDQIRRKLWIWSHLLKKSLTENFIFRAVKLKGGPTPSKKICCISLNKNPLKMMKNDFLVMQKKRLD